MDYRDCIRGFKRLLASSFLSSSATYFLSNLAAASLTLLLLPVLTRYLSTSEYGEVAIFQALLIGLSSFIGISAQGAASVKYYEDDFNARDYAIFIGNCFLILGGTIFLSFGLAIVFLSPLSEVLSLAPEWIFLGVIASGCSFIVMIRMGQWQIRKQAKNYGLFQISQSFINIVLSLLLVIGFSAGANGRILALILSPLLFSVLAFYLLKKDKLIEIALKPKDLFQICSFGIPLIPHSVGYFLLSSADRFVINDRFGLAEVGIYMVAVQLVAVMGLLFDAINNAYVPWLFEKLKRNIFSEKKEIVRLTYTYFMMLIFIVTLAFLIGPLLLTWIAGEKYQAAGELVGWLALGQAFSGMYLMVTNYIFFSGRTGLLSLSTLTSGLINISLLILLTSYFDLKGAAIAYSIAMGFKFIFTWYIAHLQYPMPWFSFGQPTESVK